TGDEDLTLVRFSVGDRTYCSEFGGQASVKQAGFLSLRNAPAPEHCRAVCGDGVLTTGEQCDPPDGVSCDERCRAICLDEETNVLVDCVNMPAAGLSLAANADTFAAVYPSGSFSESHMFLKRLDAVGQ